MSKSRKLEWIGILGLVLTWPVQALAKPLCFTDTTNNATYVLTTAKVAKAKAKPASGYRRLSSGNSSPVFGGTAVNQDGTAYVIALTVPNVVLFGGTSNSPGAEQLNIGIFESDGSLDVGDIGSGVLGTSTVSLTIIDCKTAPPLPTP